MQKDSNYSTFNESLFRVKFLDSNRVQSDQQPNSNPLTSIMSTSLKFVLPLVFAGLGLLLTTVAVLFYISQGQPSFVPFYDYGIAIDAGSSHSEAILYQWSNDRRVIEIDSCTVTPGIDAYGADTQRTVDQLLPCVVKLAKEVNSSTDPTPLILAATAGMRMVQLKNASLANKIFADIYEAFKQLKPSNTDLLVQEPRILPDNLEGLYAWITANYLLHLIPPEDRNACSKIPKGKTVGILDMGGASAQIAYSTTAGQLGDNETTESTTLFHKKYNVFTYSNLCMGGDQARHRYLALLIKANSGKFDNIDDPCLNAGSTRAIKGTKFIDLICLLDPNGQKPSSYIVPNKTYTFRGEPNAEKCDQLVQVLTQPAKCLTNFQLCPRVSSVSPPDDTPFLAMSNYYHATRVIPKTAEKSSLTYEDFKSGKESFCNLTKGQLEDDLDNICHTKLKYCQNYCFILPFIERTLLDIYKFDRSHWPSIEFAKDVGGVSLGWALGDMLVVSNNAPGVQPGRPLVNGKLPLWASLIVLLAGLILLAIGLLKWRGWIHFGYESV